MEELEKFRIKYIGTKNVIKPLSGEIRNIANELKRDFGQLVNTAKQVAENKFKSLQDDLKSSQAKTAQRLVN